MNIAVSNPGDFQRSEHFPPVRELTIEGVKKPQVIETRLAYLNEKEARVDTPATTRKLAERFSEKSSGTERQQRSVDQSCRKKQPGSSFRLIETTDLSLGTIMAAKAVDAGLREDETTVLLSFQNPQHLQRKLEMTGVDIHAAIKAKKLVIFNLETLLDSRLGDAVRYKELFASIAHTMESPVDRIVILEMDGLVNLESQHAAYMSVSKFAQAADETGCKVIAQYVRKHDEEHDRLDAASSSVVPAYFVMCRDEQTGKYQLGSKNHPV